MNEFAAGPVLRDQYLNVEKSDTYISMRSFSNEFLERNREPLSAYARLWSKDPLSDWSRRWEYPFVGSRLLQHRQHVRSWLDAGAGLTFLPFWIQREMPDTRITCLDANTDFPRVFQQFQAAGGRIDYRVGNLMGTGLGSDSFDAISCVSVMEHLPDPIGAMREMHRLLRPGGLLLLTFDIGLDQVSDLTSGKLTALLEFLTERFDDPDGATSQLERGEHLDGRRVETRWINDHWPDRLPWRYPRLSVLKSALKKGKLSFKPLKWLTFSCHCLFKR